MYFNLRQIEATNEPMTQSSSRLAVDSFSVTGLIVVGVVSFSINSQSIITFTGKELSLTNPLIISAFAVTCGQVSHETTGYLPLFRAVYVS